MQLKYNNQVKNEVIALELETTSFSKKENEALDRVGEPIINLEKIYEGVHPVSIVNRKLRSSFKIRIKFEGKEDIITATRAANSFLEEIKVILEEEMRVTLERAEDLNLEFMPGVGFYDIT